ncbi:hypothetical protein [Glaciibacter psychrotolerans]|uniref:Uncharacterized protein n=1 Tax=Glaciibacter psychrotolerans TaxID=670054 RepID=A0A7Z0J5N8_9MICO|nr:hypothetical protein [Leifsonia psychrotolerans]NYJ19610.1 hypothetical protein [Leifsonia psychrotolerans]
MAFAISPSPDDELPTREDGAPFPYAFVVPSGAALFADTVTELVEQIIVGYVELPEMDAEDDPYLEARLDHLAVLAAKAQATVVATLEEEGQFVVEDLSEDTLTALFTRKDGPVLEFDEWREEIPLILFTTNYAPFSEFERPVGENIIWLNAYTERTYLDSLEKLGVGELHVRADDEIVVEADSV